MAATYMLAAISLLHLPVSRTFSNLSGRYSPQSALVVSIFSAAPLERDKSCWLKSWTIVIMFLSSMAAWREQERGYLKTEMLGNEGSIVTSTVDLQGMLEGECGPWLWMLLATGPSGYFYNLTTRRSRGGLPLKIISCSSPS
jgi:hypothetical protein